MCCLNSSHIFPPNRLVSDLRKFDDFYSRFLIVRELSATVYHVVEKPRCFYFPDTGVPSLLAMDTFHQILNGLKRSYSGGAGQVSPPLLVILLSQSRV